MDKLKLVLAVVVVVLSITGFYYYEDQSTLIRVAGLLAGVAVGIVLMLLTDPGRAFKLFVGETRGEFRKIVWPTRKETVQTTMIVMVLVFFVALFLWLLDTVVLIAIEYLTK